MTLTPAQKRNRLKWADGLVSRRYRQYRGGMRGATPRSLCCLAVAHAELDPKGLEWAVNQGVWSNILMGKLGYAQDDTDWFIEANDNANWTFADIAQAIRDEVEAG